MDLIKFAQSDLATVLMAVQTAVLIIDKDTHEIVFANVRAAEIAGLTPFEIIGKKCFNFICPTLPGNCPVCKHGKVFHDEPFAMLRADGTSCPILKSVKALSLDGRDYLLETYIDLSNVLKKKQQWEYRYRQQNELQKLLLLPGDLKSKLNEICFNTANMLKLKSVNIILDEEEFPLSQKPPLSESSSLVLCSSTGSFYDSFTDSLSDFYQGESSTLSLGNSENSIYASAVILRDSEEKRLGLLVVFSVKELAEKDFSFLSEIGIITSRVIINGLSEFKIKDALELTEKANRLMEGREARIRAMKKEINDLTSGLGWGNVYKDFDSEDFSDQLDMTDMMALRKNALSLAEDAEIERLKAVEAHRQLTLIQHAVNSSEDSIVITLSNGDIYYTNHTFNELFGYTAAEIMMSRQQVLFSDAILFNTINELTAQGDSWTGNAEVLKHDGTMFPVMLRVSSIKNDEEELLGSIWHYIDISKQVQAQKRIEEDLKEKRELLRKAMILQNSYIQRTIPLIDSFNIRALFYPSEYLGGDFFRIIKGMREDKVVLLMGDCTDHGIKASMDASLLSSLSDPLLHYLYEGNRTDLFLAEISRQFSTTADEDQFPTMMVMVIDCGEGAVFYSSANSTNPLILREGKVQELPRASGLHIGYEENPLYERKRFDLLDEDRILLFSDSVTESLEGGYLHFDNEHIKEIFISEGEKTVDFFNYLAENLTRDGVEFNTRDDTTIILLEYKAPRNITLEFSDLDTWKKELEEIRSLLSDFDYSPREIEPITISLDEMCLNAFNHGNKGNRGLKVSLEGSVSCSGIRFQITDEGVGFNYNSVPNPASLIEQLMEEDREEEFIHGRGIWICRNYMDEVTYNEAGNSVTLFLSKNQRSVLISGEAAAK